MAAAEYSRCRAAEAAGDLQRAVAGDFGGLRSAGDGDGDRGGVTLITTRKQRFCLDEYPKYGSGE